MPSLKLVNSYLSKRRQRIKINDVDSSWSEMDHDHFCRILGLYSWSIIIQYMHM